MRLRHRSIRIIGLWLTAAVVGGFAARALATRGETDPGRLATRAADHLRANHLELAGDALRRLERLRPPTAADRMLRGQLALASGRLDEAIAELALVPEDDPAAPLARLRVGQAEIRRDHLRAAEPSLLAALALDPTLVQANRELIFLYGIQLRRGEFRSRFAALGALTPLGFDDVLRWCIMGEGSWSPLEGEDNLRRFVEADPQDRWSRLALASVLRQLGRPDEVSSILAPLPESDPEALAFRAELALERGDDHVFESILASPEVGSPGLDRLIGRLALSRGDAPTAIARYRSAYQAEPRDRDSLLGLGQALTMAGDGQGAAPFLAAIKRRSELCELLRHAETPESRSDPALARKLGAACRADGRPDEARAWYRLAIGRDPLDTESQGALRRLGTPAPPPVPRRPTGSRPGNP